MDVRASLSQEGELDLYPAVSRVIRERRSIRHFLPEPVSDEDLGRILEAARWAPSGVNTQPWEFVVVRSPERLLRIAEILITYSKLFRQREPRFPVTGHLFLRVVPAVILVCLDGRWKGAMAAGAAEEMREAILHQSLGAAVQNIHLAAASLGLGTAWLTVPPKSGTERRLREVVQVPPELEIRVCIPVGHPLRRPPSRYRRPLESMVHWEVFDPMKQKTLEDIQFHAKNLNRAVYGSKESLL